MEASELSRLSQTVIVNLSLDSTYGVSCEVEGDKCVWTCAIDSAEDIIEILVDYAYIGADVNFVLREEE